MVKPSLKQRKPSKDLRCVQNGAAETNNSAPFGIVGIGASAGGLAALETFFTNLPAATGLAFVIVTHLDPAHESLLPELLQKHSSIPLQLAQEAMQIKPDSAYFIPPNKDLAVCAGRLQLLPPARVKRLRHPIDSFLQSLAADQGDRAIGVILSGTGTDGSLGLKSIKQQGGLVMVQDESSAQYQGMLKSAIETGLVDLVLPAKEIPEKLVEYVRFAENVRPSGPTAAGMPDLANQLPRIFNIIRNQSRLDLSDYQPEPVMRSIERRMLLIGTSTPATYADFLIKTPQEVTSLMKDLLTCVTLFFHEPKTCQVLKTRVIAELLANRSTEQPIRIWVAGCCTGEEAYSLAMLLHEQQAALKQKRRVQIFATDSDEKALEVARNGLYSANNVANLSARRLKTYFNQVEDHYKICKELRDWFIFAPHNLLHDPPFAKLDLIHCGPLLSHLKPLPQKNILERFCYGLYPGGFLVFGKPETAGGSDELLKRLDEKWRRVEPNSNIFSLSTDVRPSPAQRFTPDLEVFAAAPAADPLAPDRYATERLLQSYSPPCVVVNNDYEVVHFSTRTSRYLQPPIGIPNLNLLNIAREDLRAELRIALHKTFSSGETCQRKYQKIDQNGTVETINIFIEPIPTSAPLKQLALVVLDGSSAPALTLSSQGDPTTTGQATVKDLRIKQLENELLQTKEDLRLSAEETDTLTEEFKSSHEELLSINEELHSSNEELETSKEELQALNEELTSLNTEYKLKLAELEAANSDLSNLFNSTRIATLFLDRQLQIRLFTPALVDIYQLQKSDIGRPLQQFTCRLEVPNLMQDAEQVMSSQTLISHEVKSPSGQWFQLNISPYLTLQNSIDGVVITFIDITERKKVAELQRLNEIRLDLLVTMGQMERHSFSEVSSFMVDSAVKLTSSAFGFVGILNEAGTAITEHLCSDGNQRRCNGSEQPSELPLVDSDLWAKLRHRRKPLWIENDAGICPLTGTCPFAPARVQHFLAVPIIDKNHIVAICIVADKTSDYEELEAHQLQLMMEGFWTLLQREKARIEVLRAEDASRAKSEFLANMSHEIRTPMTINMMALERALDSQLNEDQRQTLELANNAAHSLLELLNDILDFSRIEARKLTLHKELFIVQEVVMQVTELFTMKAQEKNIQLNYRIAKDVPEILIGDEKRLRQILLNLIGNAVKFTEQGKITISIACDKGAHTPPEQQRLLFKIKDTGIGIAKEQQEQLFQSFNQVDNSSTREYGGSGLGLAICKGLTELMGGKIWLQSTPGEGSSFFLSLPFERTEEFDDAAYQLPEIWINSPEPVAAAEKRPIRVLLAEDDPQLRALEKLALTDKGWEVVEATHGKEVVEVWEKLKIDLILMDLQMPKLDGLMTTRVIRNKEKKRGGHVPIVALTAHALEEDKNKCLAVGMDDFISKPIEIAKLIQIIEKQLQKPLQKGNG